MLHNFIGPGEQLLRAGEVGAAGKSGGSGQVGRGVAASEQGGQDQVHRNFGEALLQEHLAPYC